MTYKYSSRFVAYQSRYSERKGYQKFKINLY